MKSDRMPRNFISPSSRRANSRFVLPQRHCPGFHRAAFEAFEAKSRRTNVLILDKSFSLFRQVRLHSGDNKILRKEICQVGI